MKLPDLALIGGLLSAAIWAYFLFARGRFWQVQRLMLPLGENYSPPRRVAVIIPARNEADVIGQSVKSLFRQSGIHTLQVFVVDDSSTDGTASVARVAAAEVGKSASLMVLEGRPLPLGWTGKLWAIRLGIDKARETQPDFFLLTDADTVHSADSVSALIEKGDADRRDVVSLMVSLHCRTFAEKLLIPAFVFFFFKLYPPAWIADPRQSTAGAAGGCILIRPEALARAGGVEAIRGEIIDDCALAAAVKRSGGRLWLGITQTSSSLRPYGSFSGIGRMISRTAFNQLQHSAWLLVAALLGLSVTYLLPPALLFCGGPLARTFGALAWAAMSVAYLPTIRFYRLSPLWAPTLPLTALFYMGATLHSAWMYWSGRGGEWKGRVQDPAGREK